MKKLILFFSLLIVNYSLTVAEIRYVSHSGNNTPPYLSWETAADSIMSAINISSFGDTIYVASGVYEEVVDMIDGLTLIGAGSDSCIIDTRNVQNYPGYSIEVADSCLLSSFNVYSFNSSTGIGIYVGGGNRNSTVNHCKVQAAKTGIEVWTGSQNKPFIQDNIIQNVTNGITVLLSGPIVEGNIIYPIARGLNSQLNSFPVYLNNTIICSQCVNGFDAGLSLHSTLRNNLFFGSGNYAMFAYVDSIFNNGIYGINDGWNDAIYGADLYIENNHIQNAQNGIRYDPGGGNEPVVRYNSLWNNEINFKNFTPDTTNIIANPMFNDAFTQDFHLQMFSPLIDAGDPAILDVDGSRSDIGIYGGPFGERYVYNDLAPAIPINFTATLDTNYIILSWNKNTEADFSHYNLYRDTVQGFTIDSTNLAASVTDSFYLNIIPAGVSDYFFKLTAVDSQGNESSPSIERHIVLTSIDGDNSQEFSDFRLYQNFPNPFNPTTRISYQLKERGYVKLYVYDVKGELIKTLVNQYQKGGYYEVEFTPETHSATGSGKSRLASGIYIYQIMVRSENNIPVFSDINKMIYLK